MAYSESMKPKHTNPFTATLGATPPLLVGRSDAIDDFGFALDEGPGAHERISLIIGPAASGKPSCSTLSKMKHSRAAGSGSAILQQPVLLSASAAALSNACPRTGSNSRGSTSPSSALAADLIGIPALSRNQHTRYAMRLRICWLINANWTGKPARSPAECS